MSDQQFKKMPLKHSGIIKIYPTSFVEVDTSDSPEKVPSASHSTSISQFRQKTAPDKRTENSTVISDSDLFRFFKAAEEKKAHLQRKKEQIKLKKEKRQKNAHKKNKM